MRQLPLDISPQAEPRFECYVPGANREVWSALQEGRPPAPVLLWGERGTGKSHLLRACATWAHESGVTAGFWSPQVPAPWHLDPAVRWVLIDDVDALCAEQQHAAFALLVEAQGQGAVWTTTASVPPVDLPLRDDLRSRLAWGTVYALQPLDEAGTREVLVLESARRGFHLADEVLHFLMTRFVRDLHHLVDLLDRLDDYALAERRPITVPLLKQMLHNGST